MDCWVGSGCRARCPCLGVERPAGFSGGEEPVPLAKRGSVRPRRDAGVSQLRVRSGKGRPRRAAGAGRFERDLPAASPPLVAFLATLVRRVFIL